MFGFSKNKDKYLLAPTSGKIVNISEVPDATFAQKLLGDGIAVDCQDELFVAPCSGTLSMVSETKHAFVVTSPEGLEVLVHIGLDTVNLKGNGFVQLLEEGAAVKAGDKIIKVDLDLVRSKNLSLISPLVITNMEVVKQLETVACGQAEAGKTQLMKYRV